MKKITLAIIFACCTLALAAQDVIRVNYKGARPTISDFAWAFLSDYVYNEDEDVLDEARNAAKNAWNKYRQGLSQNEGDVLTIDEKNGYAVYESRSEYESVEDMVRIEMCYWNESDGKHKLFAYNVACFRNGKFSPGQFDGLLFYRYDNATKKMTYVDAPGFTERYGTDDGAYVTYSLPRTGKDIIYQEWKDDVMRKQKTLKWNGRRFSF